MNKLSEKDFGILIDRIRDGDCVLFLGPDLFRDGENKNFYEEFSRRKTEQMKQEEIMFDETQSGNIYYTVNRYIRGMSDLQLVGRRLESTSGLAEKRAFTTLIESGIKENTLYGKLAELPFYLTINTNPDDMLLRCYQKKAAAAKYHFSYYDFMRENNELVAEKELPDEINPDNFVLYNVYGHATKERARSLITSEAEFIQFTRKVNLPNNGMPACIKNFIRNEKYCLFLGFNYEQWSLKILLQALGFTGDTPKQNISFAYNGLTKYHRDFYSDEMKFLFIDNNTEEFIDELVRRFGTDSPAPTLAIQPDKPLKGVFISKAFPGNEDEKQDIRIREKISAQLKPLQTKGYISLWSEDLKIASENEAEIIQEKYSNADIFILLGSDTLADQQVSERMLSAIAITKQDTAKKIVPVYVRYYAIEQIDGIESSSWIPKADNKPVPIIDDGGNEDKKCAEVSDEIRKLITEILSKKKNG